MNIEEVTKRGMVDFSDTPPEYYLIGLLSAFDNRFQAKADNTMKEISHCKECDGEPERSRHY